MRERREDRAAGRPADRAARPTRRRGVVLLAVLIVVTILMLVGYEFYNLMTAEHEAAAAATKVGQTRMLADSGLHYAAFVLSHPEVSGLSDADGSLTVAPQAVYDNPGLFHRRPVSSASPFRQGYFSIVAPRDADDPLASSQGFRFGVEDESGKLNVNTLAQVFGGRDRARDALAKLPGMTSEIADSILNWTQPAGSSDSAAGDAMYYASLGYSPKYGPFESFEELLLVRGITPRLLLGNDLNRNGLLDAEEADGEGVLEPGLARFLTLYSRERNVDSTGQPRINLNDSDIDGLSQKLTAAGISQAVVDFIILYRRNGGGSASSGTGQRQGTGGTGASGSGQRSGGGNSRLRSVFELVDATVTITQQQQMGNARVQMTINIKSPLTKDDPQSLREQLALLWDKATTTQGTDLPARVNINTAPKEVLLALPGLTEADVQNIIDHRPTADSDPSQAANFRTPVWLLSEVGFEKDLVQRLDPYITTRSSVFRLQAVGYYDAGGPTARIEAVVDTTGGRTRILYWRDLSEIGRGYDFRGQGP